MTKKYTLLLSELDAEWSTIEGLRDVLDDVISDSGTSLSEVQTVYAGYVLHNLYCALEDVFERIASTFENTIDDAGGFHIGLVKRMKIEVYKTRPAFLSNESFSIVNELRSFRHLFRHAYGYNLDSKRVEDLGERVVDSWGRVESDKDEFRKFLLEMVDEG